MASLEHHISTKRLRITYWISKKRVAQNRTTLTFFGKNAFKYPLERMPRTPLAIFAASKAYCPGSKSKRFHLKKQLDEI
jgi:hypothetical protein